jgi:hypothetical protein
MRLRLLNETSGKNDPFFLGVCSEYHNYVPNTTVCDYDIFFDFPREMRGWVQACAGARIILRTYQEPALCFTGLTSYEYA